MKKLILIASLCFFMGSMLYAGIKYPVGVLFQVKGKVEYTKKGNKWKKVRRNKFLFRGYQVRTGENGSGKVTIQDTGENFQLTPNSLIEVTKAGLKPIKGSISNTESSSKLMSGLMKKFTRSQSYTTVRRSASGKTVKIDAVRKVILTTENPYLVWSNIGSDFEYKLTVGGSIYNAPATQEDIVRVKIEPFEGEKTFKIEVLKQGETVVTLKPYKSRGKEKFHAVSWMKKKQQGKLQKDIMNIKQTYGETSFMLGSFYEKKGMWVAAMDQYKEYLQENPDEIEMTPYLFRVYKKLRLNNIYQKELTEWKTAMTE